MLAKHLYVLETKVNLFLGKVAHTNIRSEHCRLPLQFDKRIVVRMRRIFVDYTRSFFVLICFSRTSRIPYYTLFLIPRPVASRQRGLTAHRQLSSHYVDRCHKGGYIFHKILVKIPPTGPGPYRNECPCMKTLNTKTTSPSSLFHTRKLKRTQDPLRHIFPFTTLTIWSVLLHKRGSRENNNGTTQRAPTFAIPKLWFSFAKNFRDHKGKFVGY